MIDRLVAETRGNPLALLETAAMADACGTDGRIWSARSGSRFPDRIEEIFQRQLTQLRSPRRGDCC